MGYDFFKQHNFNEDFEFSSELNLNVQAFGNMCEPLDEISLLAVRLRDENISHEKRLELADLILLNCERQRRGIYGLIEGEIQVNSEPLKIHLFDSLERVKLLLERLADDLDEYDVKVTVLCDLDFADRIIATDAWIFDTVLISIINNALKFNIDIGRTLNITVQLEANEDEFYIRIKDDGIGISEERMPYIFSPRCNNPAYFPVDRKSAGYGLYICKQNLDRICGSISATSVEGEGAEFTVKLQLGKECITKLCETAETVEINDERLSMLMSNLR